MNITQEDVWKTGKTKQEKTFNESELETNHVTPAVFNGPDFHIEE